MGRPTSAVGHQPTGSEKPSASWPRCSDASIGSIRRALTAAENERRVASGNWEAP